MKAAAGHAVVGKAPPAKGGFTSVIILEPRVPRDFPVPTEPKVMDQFGMGFNPDFLLVRAWQPVEFRNSEDVLHNVRVTESATRQPVFNVSPAPFQSYVHTFERPGFYAVSRDIHPSMHADILVTSTPYAVVADNDGTFTFPDVSPGSYTLTVYYGGRRIERAIEVAGSRTELIVDDQ